MYLYVCKYTHSQFDLTCNILSGKNSCERAIKFQKTNAEISAKYKTFGAVQEIIILKNKKYI